MSQMGVLGTSEQPPVAVQSTHLWAVVSHLSFLPEHPESSTQSTHVAVVGSHWFSPPVQPVLSAGSQSEQRPWRVPVDAQAPACFAWQRVFAFAAPLQATHWFDSHKGAAGFVQSVSARHSTQAPGVPVQKRDVPVPEHGADAPQRQPRALHVFESVELQATPQAMHWLALVAMHVGNPLRSQQSWSEPQPAESNGSQAPHCPSAAPV